MEISKGEAIEAVHRWAEEVIRGQGIGRATITSFECGRGYPHPVGGPQNPPGIQTHAERRELEIFLPPEAGEDCARRLQQALETRAREGSDPRGPRAGQSTLAGLSGTDSGTTVQTSATTAGA